MTPAPNDVRRVLFVCLGNICRSPTGEGVLRQRVAERGLEDVVEIDSAGTGAWHVGEPADARMRRAATARGYELPSRARQVSRGRLPPLRPDRRHGPLEPRRAARPRPRRRRAELRLYSDFLPSGSPADVPDPYYGGPQGFDRVIDLIEEGADAHPRPPAGRCAGRLGGV